MKKDTLWLIIWISALSFLIIWDALFLNKPSFIKLAQGTINTITIALLVTGLTFLISLLLVNILHLSEQNGNRGIYVILTFLLNLIRSVPQILGVLFGYIFISISLEKGTISQNGIIFIIMSICMSLFIMNELIDLLKERIHHFQRTDFYNAMQVCGISEMRIVNYTMFWKNSRLHIFNKLISIFGIAVFLQCSVDFVISVGLSTNVNAVNLPPTLGALLANIESKQDILAIGYALTHPWYISKLPFEHLQGLSIAFVLVISLMSIFQIANGFAERHRL